MKKRTDWGVPHSVLRILMVAALVAELKDHLGPDVERDRAEMISGSSSRLDGLEWLLESWKIKRR